MEPAPAEVVGDALGDREEPVHRRRAVERPRKDTHYAYRAMVA